MTQILFRTSTQTEDASVHSHHSQRPSRQNTASASASHANWPLTNNPAPNFSHKASALPPSTNSTTARFAKYGLGKGSKTAKKARTSGKSSTQDQTQRLTVLNATPALEPGFFDADRTDRAPVLLRPRTPLTFGRPGFPRAASSPAAMGASHRRNLQREKAAPHDLSSFTALPVSLSRAAAKRLGVVVDPGREVARTRTRQYSVSTSSDNHSLSDEAPSISDMSDRSVNYHGARLGESPAPASGSNQESWPLSSRPLPSSGMREDSIYSTSSNGESSNIPAAALSLPPALKSSLRHDGDRLEKSSRNTSQSRPGMQSRHVSWSDSQASQSPRLQHASVSRMHATKEIGNTSTERSGEGSIAYRNPAMRSDVLQRHYHQYLQQSPPLEAEEPYDLQLEATRSNPTTQDFAAFIEQSISPKSAEEVIHRIFQHADNFADLFAIARLNRGFYSVFKRHELELMKGALYNFSPAAWEYRESSSTRIITGKHDSFSDYTPTTYVQFHRRDQYIINDLRTQIARHCQRILRQDTINNLHNAGSAGTRRIDDAIWRIWTFCDIFAVNRRTENDFSGQMAWLNGTRSPPTTSSRTKTPSSSRTSTSTNASTKSRRSFARGNPEGLATDEIEDILEIWASLGILLQGIKGPGRVAQARRYGVFTGMDMDFSSPRAEEAMLGNTHHQNSSCKI
jgi:hypothetical protein